MEFNKFITKDTCKLCKWKIIGDLDLSERFKTLSIMLKNL